MLTQAGRIAVLQSYQRVLPPMSRVTGVANLLASFWDHWFYPPPGRELGIPTPESDALSNALRR